MPALTHRQWPAVSSLTSKDADADVTTADAFADLVRRYLRLDDDMLHAWATEWLPPGWEAQPLPTPPTTPIASRKASTAAGKKGPVPTAGAKGKKKPADADRFSRMLPRDNVALRQRLAGNARLVAKGTAAASDAVAVPYGVRLLRQDPWENLLSFLCSQNNHQRRIAGMVDALCHAYGERIPVMARTPDGDELPAEWRARGSGFLCSFPTAAALRRRAEDAKLRELGFGYRAKFIAAMAQAVPKSAGGAFASMPDGGFSAFVASQPTVAEQRALLTALPGVGRKVADCVLLFAYDRLDIVPIDTHMAQITHLASAQSWAGAAPERKKAAATKKAAAAKKAKPATKDAEAAGKSAVVSLTPKVHDAFQAHYTHVFGRWAGWAHCLLFAPRLTTSSVTLPRE